MSLASKYADMSVWTGSNGWAHRMFRSVGCLRFGCLRNNLWTVHDGVWRHVKGIKFVRLDLHTGFRTQNNMQNWIWPRTRQDHRVHPECRRRNLHRLLHWNGPAHKGRARWVAHLMLILRLGLFAQHLVYKIRNTGDKPDYNLLVTLLSYVAIS